MKLVVLFALCMICILSPVIVLAGAGLPFGGQGVETLTSGTYAFALRDSALTATISILGTATARSEPIYVGNAERVAFQFLCSSDSDSVHVEVRQQNAILGLDENNLTNNSTGLMFIQPTSSSTAIVDTLDTETWSPVKTLEVDGEGYKRLLFTGLTNNSKIASTVITIRGRLGGPR